MAPRKKIAKDTSAPVEPAALSELELTKTTLIALGLSEGAVAYLMDQGLTTRERIKFISESHLAAAGVPAFVALEVLAKIKASQPAAEVEEDIVLDEKPTVKSAGDPKVAGALGIDSGLLTALALGGGDPSLMFGMINVKQLLAMYDPMDVDNLAAVILQKRFGDMPVIAFKKGASEDGAHEVALEETAKYILDLRRGRKQQTRIMVDGKPTRLYKVGVIPNDFVPEDPMVPGQALWEEQSDTYAGANWAGVPMKVRQLVRIALKNKLFNPENGAERMVLMNLVRQGWEAVAMQYPDAALRFDELQAAGKLPSLRVQPTVDGGTGKGGADLGEDDYFRSGGAPRSWRGDGSDE